LVAVVSLAIAGGALASAPALAAAPLNFSARVPIDTHPLTGVSCPTTTLCVAVDSAGSVVVSTDPIGGTWTSRSVDPSTSDTPGGFNAISCPSASFCVAVGSFGQAATSTDPAVLSSWQLIAGGIDEPANLTGVSCSSATRCVAVDGDGYAVTTNAPAGQPLLWARTSSPIDTQTTHLTGVSCASTDLCVAVDGSGYAMTATQTDPSVWNLSPEALIDPHAHTIISGVSCASVTLCLAVDFSGYALVSTDPRHGSPTWTPVQLENNELAAVSCVSGPLCMVGDSSGRASVSPDPAGSGPAGAVEADWFGPSPVDPVSGTPVHTLTAVSCPSVAECVAVDDAGGAVLGTLQHVLTVAVAGSGGGTITGSGISCPTACTSSYLAGTDVPLVAHAASGSTFSGWSGACSGQGPCTATISSDERVTATFAIKPPPGSSGKFAPPNTVITRSTIRSHRKTATFRFHATGRATSLQCATVRKPTARRHHKHPRPPKARFSRCRSPEAVKHLRRGHYTFFVRARGPGGVDRTPARRNFRIG
jgi:hypothetical protein